MLQLRLVAQLSDWLLAEDLDVSGLTVKVRERFITAARRAEGARNHTMVKALAPLMGQWGQRS